MKIRVTVHAVAEYEATPENYPSPDHAEMLIVDKANFEDDPVMIFDWAPKIIVSVEEVAAGSSASTPTVDTPNLVYTPL